MQNKLINQSLSFAFIVTIGLLSCTKKVDYKYVNKDEVLSKSTISNDEYLYVASTAQSSKDSADARPYWQGEEKIVKMQFSKNSLDVYEIERDSRYNQNRTNDKLVLSIPVDHLDYKCTEDSFGKCTQSEEKNEDLAWYERQYFKPNVADIKIVENSLLPLELENLFNSGCYKKESSKLLGYEITDKKINIEIENVFNKDISCVSSLDRLSDLTISQVYHYSFAKLNSIASNDYQPVTYPETDENTFGFFNTVQQRIDVDHNTTEDDTITLMNRWNPKRKVIDYVLSPEFSKPENKLIKEATVQAVQKINDGLAAAEVDLKVVLHDNDGTVKPGDITHSMIVLVEDPSASSVLGYGPTVANPKTGEILSGRVVMYKGILESYIKYSYEEIRQAKIRENIEKQQKNQSSQIKLVNQAAALFALSNNETVAETESEGEAATENVGADATESSRAQKMSHLKTQKTVLKPAPLKDTALISKIKKDILNTTKNKISNFKDPNYLASKHCLFSPEALSISPKVKADLQKILGDSTDKWEDLSSSTKAQIMEAILPVSWVPTLVHELGHNLGLRHNFQGSEDKNNFYSKEELSQMGVDNEVQFSSVMDYGSSEVESLPALGKYDIAALRFGYNRQVVTQDNTIIDVSSNLRDLFAQEANLRDQLKSYQYCTDENVGANAGCKRFDAGTTYPEIAKSLIQNYDENYNQRNFRNKRLSFSQVGDLGYKSRMDYIFENLRIFFEIKERIAKTYSLTYDDPIWQTNPFLKEIEEASKLAADFYLRVLKTPSLTCAIATKSDLQTIQYILPISELNKILAVENIDCFDVDFTTNPGLADFVVVGSYGKMLNNAKSPKSINPYADQIDVRGMWIDKVLALDYLTKRKLDSSLFDKNLDSYLDDETTKKEILETIKSMNLNTLKTEVTVKSKEGLNLISGVVQIDTHDTHKVKAPLFPQLAEILGLPMNESLLTNKLNSHLRFYITDGVKNTSALNLAHSLKANVLNLKEAQSNSLITDKNSLEVAGVKLWALPEQALAQELISLYKLSEATEVVGKDYVYTVYDSRLQGIESEVPVDTLEPNKKLFWDIDQTVLENFVSGQLMTKEQYFDLLNSLDNAEDEKIYLKPLHRNN